MERRKGIIHANKISEQKAAIAVAFLIQKIKEEEQMEENKATNQEDFEKEMEEAKKTGVVNMEDKKQKKEGSDTYVHKFSEPVEIEGQKYKELIFYFGKLCGEDIEAIEEELQDQNKYVLTPEISSAFQSMLAARAAKIPADAIRRLPIRDYMAIKNKARNFLINMG